MVRRLRHRATSRTLFGLANGHAFVCGFFFAEVTAGLHARFANLYSSPDSDEIAAGIENIQRSFGGYMTLKRIAEAGVFNLPNMSPIKAAERAPLWDAWYYLSSCAAIANYQNELTEIKTKR